MISITEPSFDETEIDMVRAALDSKWVTQGPMTERFEALIAARHQARFAMACTSATSALHLSALALKLKAGDEVVVPAFTWITTANSAEYVGAKAVFADIDLNTFNLDPKALEAAITPRTKAVVVVHLFGLSAPMDEIKALCAPRGIRIIEDAACAIGTMYNGKPVGALGDIGCFSFHPRKVVTTGEGGAVTTNDPELAAAVRSYRNHGATGLPSPDLEPHGPWSMATFNNLGFNLRLSDIQAAVGVAQMAKLDRLLAERRARAARYTELLSGQNAIVPPSQDAGHTYQSYVTRLADGSRKQRNAIMTKMTERQIQTRPGTHAVHQLGYYKSKYGLPASQFPNASLAEDTTITLPILPGMTDAQQDLVVEVFLNAIKA